jgi:predicted dehydrogenase
VWVRWKKIGAAARRNAVLRIGILGAAGIAPAAVIRPARRRTDVEVVAVASRREESARQFAERHRIDRFYSDYAALLSDPGVDLVYIALPPSEHAK